MVSLNPLQWWRSVQASDRAPAAAAPDTTVRVEFGEFTEREVDPFAGFTVERVGLTDQELAQQRREREERGRQPGRGPFVEVEDRRQPGRGPFFEVEQPTVRPAIPQRVPIYGAPSPVSVTFTTPPTPPPERPKMAFGMMKGQTDPLFSARQNVIEACKHLAQVEEHLFRPTRRCADCVDKHLRLAEGYADEMLSLDPSNIWAPQSRMIAMTARGAIRMLEGGASPEQVAQAVRSTRKACASATRSFTLERGGHLRALFSKRNLAIGAAALGALYLVRR